ncbi:ATP-dependent helicase [Candidatus Woesebacteria bacterium]|nr:ATP-dependent helicase [Candidatus Woesebacteria bacterium]
MNTLQQKAIHAEKGPVLIKAGPGTGKTKTLTARIEYLVTEKKVLSSSILALTFTRKAAAEMKERLSHMSKVPIITTFHAFAYDILKKAGYTFEIISDKDRNEIIHSLIEKGTGKEGSKKDMRDISLEISQYKNAFEMFSNRAVNNCDNSHFIEQYNDQLKLRNCVDYDDLILFLYKEVSLNNEKISMLLQDIQHILVDEFQDTNRLQYETIKLFCKPENLFIIGDPYQSIYSFRGATADIFDLVKKDFPETMEIIFRDNYRSTKEIILAGAALFPDMKPLQSHQEGIGSVRIVTTYDEYSEARYALQIINQHIGGIDLLNTESTESDTIRFSDVAVIYRNHYIGRTLQRIFLDSGIPFQVVGEDSPYKKDDIAFISALLSYSLKKDDQSLEKVLYSSCLNVPRKLLRLIRNIQNEKNNNLHEALRCAMGQEYGQDKQRNALSIIINKLKKTVESIQNKKTIQSIHIICEGYKIEQSLDLQQFLSCPLRFEETGGLKEFVQYLYYLEEHEFYDPRAEKVTLMTMHASKGLEFDTVCICGFEQGVIPSNKNEGNGEEEKRLLYVALTRAKKHLYLIYPQERRKEKSQLSSFSKYLSTLSFVESVDDEAIIKLKKKRETLEEKKTQLTLF